MDQTLVNILTSLMLIIGATIMAINVIISRGSLHRNGHLKHSIPTLLNTMFRVHQGLIVFFLFGYIGAFIAILLKISFFSELLIGTIFLFGAIFVFLSNAVQNKMFENTRENYFNAIRMLIRAVEIRDPYTMGHSEHVANLCMLIYNYLPSPDKKGLDPELLHSTALMHDIGKIGVPEHILNKTGHLNDDEWESIRRHTDIGKDLLSKMEVYSSVPDWVAYHHERIDGYGYHNLPEDKIPFAARLMAVADTFSAIVTNRPYRQGKSYYDAISILQNNAGTQLDANLVMIFSKIPQEEVEKCRPQALILDFIKQIETMEQQRLQGESSNQKHEILSAEAGELWLQRISVFCKQHEEVLTIAALSFEGLEALELSRGYHTVDELMNKFGALLLSNIRNSDILVHSQRNSFILCMPNSAKEEALSLLSRLESEIAAHLKSSRLDSDLKKSRQMVYYSPQKSDSWDSLMLFFNEHFKGKNSSLS